MPNWCNIKHISKTACCYENQFIPGNPLVCLLRCFVGHGRSVHLISTDHNTILLLLIIIIIFIHRWSNSLKRKVFQLFTRISHRFFFSFISIPVRVGTSPVGYHSLPHTKVYSLFIKQWHWIALDQYTEPRSWDWRSRIGASVRFRMLFCLRSQRRFIHWNLLS